MSRLNNPFIAHKKRNGTNKSNPIANKIIAIIKRFTCLREIRKTCFVYEAALNMIRL